MSAGEGGWRRTSVLGFVVRGIVTLRKGLLPSAAVLFGSRSFSDGGAAVAGVVAAIILANLAIAWLGWRHFRYRLGAEDISVESGVFSRAARSVPYERIQDVSLEQALVPRLFGMVEVRVETGAGGQDELKIAYVSAAEGEALREAVRIRRDNAVVASEAEAEEAPGRLLFSMDPRRLLTFGLFEFSLVVFGVLAGVAQQLDFLLPFDIWNGEAWRGRLAGPGDWLAHLGFAAQIAGVALALLVLGLVGLASGIARTVLRDWNFRLEETPRGLRRQRGLLTRTDVVMPLHRVQALDLSTGIIRRRFGWHALSVVSLARDSTSASHVVVPFGTMEEIAAVVDCTGFSLPGPDTRWHRPSARHRLDRALLGVVPCAIGGVALAAAGLFLPAVGIGLLGAALALRQHYLWLHDRHALDMRQILVRRGWLAPHCAIASRVKIQSVEIRQGPLARGRGYADVVFGIAGGTLAMHGIPQSEAHRVRAAVLDSIARVDFSRLPR